jgi:hypothetical protein
MLSVWPGELPNPLWKSYELETVDTVIRFEPDHGPPLQRVATSWEPVVARGVWRLKDAHYKILRDWWSKQLSLGVKQFVWREPYLDQYGIWVFKSPPSAPKIVAPGYVDVTLELLRLAEYGPETPYANQHVWYADALVYKSTSPLTLASPNETVVRWDSASGKSLNQWIAPVTLRSDGSKRYVEITSGKGLELANYVPSLDDFTIGLGLTVGRGSIRTPSASSPALDCWVTTIGGTDATFRTQDFISRVDALQVFTKQTIFLRGGETLDTFIDGVLAGSTSAPQLKDVVPGTSFYLTLQTESNDTYNFSYLNVYCFLLFPFQITNMDIVAWDQLFKLRML